jgi:Na+-driven multidrug efflux pump/anti-sigma regulatory factor (Ser/Thr protein kinase)
MKQTASDFKMLQGLCFRLLPIQVLLAMVGAINGIVSSLFASNFVGTDAMSAIGLYSPVGSILMAVNTMLMGGSQIICGKYMGRNEISGMQNVFSVNILISMLLSVVTALVLFAAGFLDLTGMFTSDAAVRVYFNQYLMGMAVGIVPQIIGQQLSGFLSLENKNKLTTFAGIAYVLTNLALDYLFIAVLRLEALGLALATSLGLWVFAGVQLLYYVRGKSVLRLSFRQIRWKESTEIVKIGAPGAFSSGYQALRGLIVNSLILTFVGTVGISAFTASNSFLGLFWAIPNGMLAVSRMLISVAVGEEDRESLQNVMRIMFFRYLPLMSAIALALIAAAVPMTRLYYQDTSDPVFMMTVWGFRIFPLSMPFSIILMHFVCYAQVSDKKLMMHLLPVVDGVLGAAIPTALLIPFMGMISVYWANVINGIATTVIVVGYAWICNRRFPKNMSELMVIPSKFGVRQEDRLDITVRSMEEVVCVSRQVQNFCREKGVDRRRSYLAALMVEEMAGNIVSHGFRKDDKKHSVDLRIAYKNQDLILRIKDDCIPFDPSERQKIVDPEDITKNIGIRMVFSLAQDIQYQNILGMNALTIRL